MSTAFIEKRIIGDPKRAMATLIEGQQSPQRVCAKFDNSSGCTENKER
jgi:hypothetical protein